MTVILCVDDRNGVLFNNRRLSRDNALCSHILEYCGSKTLWMNSYSASIFPQNAPNIRVCEKFLDEAGAGEYCFVENGDITIAAKKAKTIVLYRWNRSYPSDQKLSDEIISDRSLTERNEFAGNSHPLITQEVYE